MSEIRSNQIITGILAFLLCVTVGAPVLAADEPAPGSTITVAGTANTEPISYPAIHELTVQLEKGAGLNVADKEAAVCLGYDGTVNLASGAQVTNTQGDASMDTLHGIKMTGYMDGEETGKSRVTMAKGAAVVVNAVEVRDWVSGIYMDDADCAYVNMDDAQVTVAAESEDVYGVRMGRIEEPSTAQVTMTNGSTLEVTGKAPAPSEKGAESNGDAYGVSIEETAHGVVSLAGASTINVAEAVTGEYDRAGSVGVLISRGDEAEVSLDGKSGVTAAASSDGIGGTAVAAGVQLYGIAMPDTAKVEVGNGSKITAIASGDYALATGCVVQDSLHGVVNVAGGSTISATVIAAANEPTLMYRISEPEAMPDAEAMAAASVLGMANVSEVEINLNNADVVGVMQATAESADSGNAMASIVNGPMGIIPVGVGAVGYDSASIQLTDARIKVSAEATAISDDGLSYSMVGDMRGSMVSGLLVSPEPVGVEKIAGPEAGGTGSTAIALQGSSIVVSGVATAIGGASAEEESQSMAVVTGISLLNLKGEQEGDAPTLQLKDSTIQVASQSSVSGTKEMGPMGTTAVSVGILAEGLSGKTTFNLDDSVVTAEAKAEVGIAAGIMAMPDEEGGILTINLSNGSRVSISSDVKTMIEGMPSSAILVQGNTTINIDSTSSLEGEWAVVGGSSGGGDGIPAVAPTINNEGLISGRIGSFGDDVGAIALNNASSGTLEATFGVDDEFGYDVNDEVQPFYFTVETASLAGGTTFRIVPTDDLGLAEPGDSQEYALLQAGESGTWDKKQLNLEAKGHSPLLGLSWVESVSERKLVARIEFLTPAEADLSGNASSAFAAALADRDSEFIFNTDPEEWSPNMSGAFLTGMTQTLGTSNANIGNRLGGLMGLNTGDEIVAAGGLWYNSAFTDADQGKRDGIEGFDADNVGFSLGLDRQAGPVTVGIACTIGNTDADADDFSSSMGMKDNLFSLYSSYDGGRWFSEAVLSAGVGSVDSTRRLDSQVLTANYDSTSYNALAKVGMKLSSAGWQINPLVAVDYSYKKYDSYTEEGGSGALDVDSQDYTVINVGGGASMQRSWVKSWGVLTPEVSAMLRYDLKGDRIITTAKFVGGSTAFVAHGVDPAETSWEFSTALTVASLEESAVSVRLGYDYAGREDFNAHSISGKVRYEF